MNIHTTVTPTQRALLDAHKARRAMWERKAVNSSPIAPKPRLHPVIAKKLCIPIWSIIPTYFDDHVDAYTRHMVEQRKIMGNPIRAYISRRAIELGSSYYVVVSGSRKRDIVAIKHLIMWEVKTQFRPATSYPELAKAFGLSDHTSALHAVKKIAREKEQEAA